MNKRPPSDIITDTNPVVAITGGIGVGKSYVCEKLRQKGIDVYDCDSAAKRLMRTSEKLKRALCTLIGDDAYIYGTLNKARISQFLLASDSNAQAINQLVHPVVAHDFRKSGKKWMECAILFESGFDKMADVVVAVTAPLEVRLQRIVLRDHISLLKAREWTEKQMNQDELVSRAHYTIVNDGVTDIDKQLDRLLTELKHKT